MTAVLKLISWNLHGVLFAEEKRRRLDLAAGLIRALEPDVVALQEVWWSHDARRITSALGAGYQVAPEPQPQIPLRRSGLLGLVRHQGGWQLRTSQFHEFEAEASDLKFWEADGLAGKGVQRIGVAYGDLEVNVLNTHLQAEYAGTNYREIRARQLGEIKAFARAMPPSSPILLVGDLNTRADEDLYVEIARAWNDLTEPLRRRCRCGTHLPEDGSTGGWIDYVLARSSRLWRVRATSVEILANQAHDLPYSDHQGLYATLEISPAGATLSCLPLWALALGEDARRMTRRSLLAVLGIAALEPRLATRGD